MSKPAARIMVLALGAVLVVSIASQIQAAAVAWQVADGAWEAPANWLTDDDTPVARVPQGGDTVQIMNGGTARITATTGTVPATGEFTMFGDLGEGTLIQTDGIVNTGWIEMGSANDATYRMVDGQLNVSGLFNMSGLDTTNWSSHFVQTGGTVTAPILRMTYNGNQNKAYYNIEGGDLIVGSVIRMAIDLSQHSTNIITQSGGTVTAGQLIQMGKQVGDGSVAAAAAIYNLDGGEITIKGDAPFTFFQPGAPVYFDFDGGALNLKGTWDFSSLTSIADSDFRAFGDAATAGDLTFEGVTLFETTYTRITATGPPPPLPGDANGNGFVDDVDLAILLGNWEQDPVIISTWTLGNFTEASLGDTDVDDSDLAVLLGNWTGPPPAGAAVPEPATLALLALGALAAIRRRRR